ncbi:hypothetical protein [Bradyrhizobium sp. STM 3562]|uniref:hypothetical protein n=1 Tax=Bradyrhizobium sp. STM 3562 TaxID=578924 RepID=UPI00388F3714
MPGDLAMENVELAGAALVSPEQFREAVSHRLLVFGATATSGLPLFGESREPVRQCLVGCPSDAPEYVSMACLARVVLSRQLLQVIRPHGLISVGEAPLDGNCKPKTTALNVSDLTASAKPPTGGRHETGRANSSIVGPLLCSRILESGRNHLRAKTNFASRIKLIWVVQIFRKK